MLYHLVSKEICSYILLRETLDCVAGLLIVILLAISWVGAQQFAQSAVTSSNFNAPYFTVWFGTCWMFLCFPIYAIFLFMLVSRQEFHSEIS